jgi:hypothetical protein
VPNRSAGIEDFDRIWTIVAEMSVYERHFNDIQARHRVLASSWLLATFVGVGFLLSRPELQLPVDRGFAIAGVAAAGAAGLVLLWNLDLLVYHQLLQSCFSVGLDFEARHTWLPPLRKRMLESQGGGDVTPRVAWFYMTGIAVLTLVATAGVATGLANADHAGVAVPGSAAVVSAGAALIYYMHRRTPRIGQFKRA